MYAIGHVYPKYACPNGSTTRHGPVELRTAFVQLFMGEWDAAKTSILGEWCSVMNIWKRTKTAENLLSPMPESHRNWPGVASLSERLITTT